MSKLNLPPIRVRMRAAYEKSRKYSDMLREVFPESHFPRAHRYSYNGGPPGCAMAFGRALRAMGGLRDADRVWLPAETSQEAAARAFHGMPWRGTNEPPQLHR